MITLNQDQRNAVDMMHQFLNSSKEMFLLEGYAGTGKTTCVQTFAREAGVPICFTAPTNKATRVLSDMAAGAGVDCMTTYSLLGLVLKGDGEARRVSAEGRPKIFNYKVVVVDEGSMVNDNLLAHCVEGAEAAGCKLIFMGDPAQLPPVHYEKSPIFDIPLRAVLTKVMRHDNQILNLATEIRNALLEGRAPVLKSDNDEKGGVYCVNSANFRKQMKRAFQSENYLDHPDICKTIAWRNVTVGGYNDFVRSVIYDEEADFHVGERVVACQPIMEEQVTVMCTDEEGVISSISVEPHPVFKGLDCYHLEIELDNCEFLANCWVIHPKSAREYNKMLKSAADNAKSGKDKWSTFWDLKEQIHDIRPCHAITAHRSQGSTYEIALVDYVDIMLNRNMEEALKCLYVAVSRASRVVVLRVK